MRQAQGCSLALTSPVSTRFSCRAADGRTGALVARFSQAYPLWSTEGGKESGKATDEGAPLLRIASPRLRTTTKKVNEQIVGSAAAAHTQRYNREIEGEMRGRTGREEGGDEERGRGENFDGEGIEQCQRTCHRLPHPLPLSLSISLTLPPSLSLLRTTAAACAAHNVDHHVDPHTLSPSSSALLCGRSGGGHRLSFPFLPLPSLARSLPRSLAGRTVACASRGGVAGALQRDAGVAAGLGVAGIARLAAAHAAGRRQRATRTQQQQQRCEHKRASHCGGVGRRYAAKQREGGGGKEGGGNCNGQRRDRSSHADASSCRRRRDQWWPFALLLQSVHSDTGAHLLAFMRRPPRSWVAVSSLHG